MYGGKEQESLCGRKLGTQLPNDGRECILNDVEIIDEMKPKAVRRLEESPSWSEDEWGWKYQLGQVVMYVLMKESWSVGARVEVSCGRPFSVHMRAYWNESKHSQLGHEIDFEFRYHRTNICNKNILSIPPIRFQSIIGTYINEKPVAL